MPLQNTTDQTHDETGNALPRCRRKSEIRAERLSWAMWAAGVYRKASESDKAAMRCQEFQHRYLHE